MIEMKWKTHEVTCKRHILFQRDLLLILQIAAFELQVVSLS